MIKGERQLRFGSKRDSGGQLIVTFDETSLIAFEREKGTENNYISLDPTELSAIYGAFLQMLRELKEEERLGK